MEDFELTLYDRIEMIKTYQKEYDLLNTSFISYSGGKDSSVLSKIVDLALPGNNIPRIYVNTGVENPILVDFVREQVKQDERFYIISSHVVVPLMLKEHGYPFLNKRHSFMLEEYQDIGCTYNVYRYFNVCDKRVIEQFSEDYPLKISDKCCYYLKKKPMEDYSAKSNRTIAIVGIRKAEGGRRQLAHCVSFDKEGKPYHINAILPVSNDFIDWFIKTYNVKLCALYYEPYNFKRTGCMGCPFNPDLENDLIHLKIYQPSVYRACLHLWKPVYKEYIRMRIRMTLNLYREGE